MNSLVHDLIQPTHRHSRQISADYGLVRCLVRYEGHSRIPRKSSTHAHLGCGVTVVGSSAQVLSFQTPREQRTSAGRHSQPIVLDKPIQTLIRYKKETLLCVIYLVILEHGQHPYSNIVKISIKWPAALIPSAATNLMLSRCWSSHFRSFNG
ncbi:hypothetical protein EX30DRAFT_61546 [Ascodesmis nigricans]|uniref:Uncharacterized protein n=1 Tax=Ascodesmis nigricans TaxID=341454 RepID=A0A4V6RHE0_9PEZI|nr:hypothetical protein EX30DRAFT_61546 [Ascodesmis nigricans]